MLNVAIFIYPEAEVLDFSGPFEVFSTANRVAPAPCFQVFFVAEQARPVVARGGFEVLPHYDFATAPPIDVLVVVGGVHTEAVKNSAVIAWVSQMAAKATLVASVCTGAFILAEAGLLNSVSVTTHWEDIADLRRTYPELHVIDNKRWVDTGTIITSGGISAGIDMSLHLVERLSSRTIALKTARQMEYQWIEQR